MEALAQKLCLQGQQIFHQPPRCCWDSFAAMYLLPSLPAPSTHGKGLGKTNLKPHFLGNLDKEAFQP